MNPVTEPLELTFVMAKPDALQRRLLGTIIQRLERKGLTLVAGELRSIPPDLAARHYAAHKGKSFYPRLIRFITSGPVFASVWKGPGAIHHVRHLVGATSPEEAHPGTIRGDFALHVTHNLVHASDSPEAARREIALFFPDEAFFDFPPTDAEWLTPRL